MHHAIRIVICLLLMGLSTACATYESQSSACEGANPNACFEAANHVWTLHASKLKPCVANESLCIKPGEGREQAMNRLRSQAIEQNAMACDKSNHAEACSRAGSGLAIMGINMTGGDYRKIAERAESYFAKACMLGSRSGCMLKGSTHRAGK